MGNFLTSLGPVSLSRRTLLHGVVLVVWLVGWLFVVGWLFGWLVMHYQVEISGNKTRKRKLAYFQYLNFPVYYFTKCHTSFTHNNNNNNDDEDDNGINGSSSWL